MANRRCFSYPQTKFIVSSIFQSLPPQQIEQKYAPVVSFLLTNGFIQDTTDHMYSLFVNAIKNTSTSSSTATNVFSLYEEYVLSIIQYVIDGIAIDTILAKLKPMQQQIHTFVQAESTIRVIEEVMLSVVENLANKVSIEMVLNRIVYLKGLLASAKDLPVAYGEIEALIETIIVSITNRTPIESVLANLMSIQTSFATEVKLAEVVTQIQTTVIGILQNIIDRVDIQFVLNRFTYVRKLLAEAAML